MSPSSRFEWSHCPACTCCVAATYPAHRSLSVFAIAAVSLSATARIQFRKTGENICYGTVEWEAATKLGKLNEGSTLESLHHHFPVILHHFYLLFTLHAKRKSISHLQCFLKQTSRVAKLRRLPDSIGQTKKKKTWMPLFIGSIVTVLPYLTA